MVHVFFVPQRNIHLRILNLNNILIGQSWNHMRFDLVWSGAIVWRGAACLLVSGLNVSESTHTQGKYAQREKIKTKMDVDMCIFWFIFLMCHWSVTLHYSFGQRWHLGASFTSPLRDGRSQSHYKPEPLLRYNMCSCGAAHLSAAKFSRMYLCWDACVLHAARAHTHKAGGCVVPRVGRVFTTSK